MSATIKIPTTFTAVDKFSGVVKQMTSNVSGFGEKTTAAIDRFNAKANKIAGGMAMAGGAIIAPLGLAVNRAIDFEDKMADVAKTTGLSGDKLANFSNEILNMSKKTRSSISDLQDIAVIGGQLGVSEDKLLGFVDAANKFGVALGGDYSGGLESAVLEVGKLNSLYSDTKSLAIDEHLMRSGSAFNALSSAGKSSAENINDFASRVGTLPGALKPSFTAVAGLGAFLEEVGIDAERGSSGFSNLMLTAAKQLPAFAREMKMSASEAKALLEQDPVAFAQKFSRSLNKLSPDKLAQKLADLKIGGQETIKIVGSLGDESNRLTDLIDLSNKSFQEATSLQDEYNTKNTTTAARLAIAKNNMEALAITVGTSLAPILNTLIETLTPIIGSIGKWAEENPKLIKTIALIGVGLLTLAGIIKGVTIALSISKFVMTSYTAIMGIYNTVQLAAAVGGYTLAGAIWATLAPILLIIAVIAAVILVIMNWGAITEWFGQKWEQFTSWISELWANVVSFFTDFDFKALFMSIGQSIIDYMLFPLKSVLKLVAMIPGTIGEAAQSGLDKLNEMSDLGVEAKAGEVLPSTNQAGSESIQKSVSQNNLSIDIRDKGNNVESVKQNGDNNGIPIKTSNTVGAF